MARPSRWNEIVDAAAEIFKQKGFVATSLEDIASAVGMYKGSLYHYIDSKEDLLFAVVREPAEKILVDIRELLVLDLPPSEKIRRATRTHVRVLEENFTYCSVYLEEMAGRHRSEEWSAMDREYVRALQAIITAGIELGEFSHTLNARTTTLAIIGALNWLTHWYHPEGELEGSQIADNFCDIFLAGMLTRRPNSPDGARSVKPTGAL
jgi:AcrR family transcriptional regulator